MVTINVVLMQRAINPVETKIKRLNWLNTALKGFFATILYRFKKTVYNKIPDISEKSNRHTVDSKHIDSLQCWFDTNNNIRLYNELMDPFFSIFRTENDPMNFVYWKKSKWYILYWKKGLILKFWSHLSHLSLVADTFYWTLKWFGH